MLGVDLLMRANPNLRRRHGGLGSGRTFVHVSKRACGVAIDATDALILCGARNHRGAARVRPSAVGDRVDRVYSVFRCGDRDSSWPSVVSVVVVKMAVELWTDALLKAILNIVSARADGAGRDFGLLALGGVGLRSFEAPRPHARNANVAGLPALVAFVCALLTNNLIVTGAIAISSGRRCERFSDNHRTTFGLDFLAAAAWSSFSRGCTRRLARSRRRRFWVPILGLRQVHRTNLELEQTNDELLELMVKSIEARDPYTSGHSRRVQQFSTIIARAIGLSERQIEEVGHAALLHDVGKIHEKYAGVLSKQDKLYV